MRRQHNTTIGIVLRLPGLIGAAWLFVPFALAWLAALVLVVLAGVQSRPALLPYTVALYACAAFFAHAYTVAWRAGSWVWRYAALLIAIALLTALMWLHLDDASARVMYPAGALVQRPSDARYTWAAGLAGLAAALLLAHGFLLGLGSRSALSRSRPRRHLLRRHPHPTSTLGHTHETADGEQPPR